VTTSESPKGRRLKYYGLNDYATAWQVDDAMRIIERFTASAAYTVTELLELYNAQQFVENGLYPASSTEEQRAALRAQAREIRSAVLKFFHRLEEADLGEVVVDVGYEHHGDLLELFSRSRIFHRCAATIVLPLLNRLGVGLVTMLASPKLVQAYNLEIRERILSDAANAEVLFRKYLEEDGGRDIHLPASLTASDVRALVDAYLDDDEANPNYLQLVSLARINSAHGIDAKIKLKAQRRYERRIAQIFEQDAGMKTGCEVTIEDDQVEPVEARLDGMVFKISFGRGWLEETLDYPSILNNFLYVFEFADHRMLLTLPAYRSQRRGLEQVLGVTGKNDYPTGSVFRMNDWRSSLSTQLYDLFLRSHGIELESVVAWFFSDHLQDEFGAAHFVFVPSSSTSTYLERSRHLFAEIESVAKQFSLYVEDGVLDTGLLGIASEPVRYASLPSLMNGKYVYPGEGSDARTVLNLLFSDQSRLRYISEELNAEDAATLLADGRVGDDDVPTHQKPAIDFLVRQDVLEHRDGRLYFVDHNQVAVLRALFRYEAASYHHYPPEVRATIDQMTGRGWLVRQSTLLTTAEASYFNFYLNQAEFSNGPDLRNRYLHGRHVNAADEDEHYSTYITALKLLIALVIKINDDFWLRDAEVRQAASPAPPQSTPAPGSCLQAR
jgi:hypothetical protein